MRPIPEDILLEAVSSDPDAGIDLLCRWWNESEGHGRRPADHVFFYRKGGQGLWREVDSDDASPRTEDELAEGGSCAMCNDILVHFRYEAKVDASNAISYDTSGFPRLGITCPDPSFRRFARFAIVEMRQHLSGFVSRVLN